MSNFLEDAFANADGGDGHAADVEVTAHGEQGDGGDTHDVGTIAAHAVVLHAFADAEFQNIGQAIAQKRKLQHGQTVFARAGSDGCESFGVASEGDGNLLAEVGAIG